jgi:hypothetical protein
VTFGTLLEVNTTGAEPMPLLPATSHAVAEVDAYHMNVAYSDATLQS